MPSLNPFQMINSIDQAEVLLTTYDDDFVVAHEHAAYNFEHAQTKDQAIYWFGVLVALTPAGEPN